MFNCGFNNNCFGINGMMPGGLMPGSSVKISQNRTGGASIFSKTPTTTTTNITVNNGPTGFWGFASGLMGGLGGTGYGMGMGGYPQMGMGMGMGTYVDPAQVSMLSNQMYTAGMSAINGGGTAGVGGLGGGVSSPALSNLEKLAKNIGGTVIDNNNGTFTLTVDNHDGVVNGTYDQVQEKIAEYSKQGVKPSGSGGSGSGGSGSGGSGGGTGTE